MTRASQRFQGKELVKGNMVSMTWYDKRYGERRDYDTNMESDDEVTTSKPEVSG